MIPKNNCLGYVALGYAVGADGEDLHGTGAVRFDTKVVRGPAGEDPECIYNYARLPPYRQA